MKDKKCYNPPDRRRKKKVSSRSIAAKIASSMLATVTAATTIASPVLTYAADVNGMDTVTETTTDASQGETKTIISTDSDSTETEKDAETKFLLINLKTSGGKVVIDENEDDEQTVKLANHKSDDGKTDEMRIDVYDKDDILVSSEDAAKNSYTYAYEVKADSVTNVKADADEGYILKLYDIVEGDTEKDSGFDEKTDGITGEFEYPVFMDSNVTVKVEFEKEEVKEDGKTETKDSAETDDLTVDESTDKTEKTDGNEKTADSSSTDADAKDSSDSTGDLTVNDNVYVSPNGQTQTEIGTDENSNDAETDEDKAPDNEDTADTADDSTAETADNADSVENEADAEDSSEAGAAEEDAGDVTEEDAEADSTEADATDTDSTDTDTAEHFTDTSDAEGGLNKDDFSSARLLVMTDDENDIIDKEHMIGSYGDIYLLQYESAEQAMTAYSYYKEHVDAVEPDAKIVAASENVAGAGEATTAGETEATTGAMTKDDNAVAALNTEESSSKATVYSDDTANKVIALIDTGAAESSNVIDRVSLIDDVLNGGTHGDDMVNDIVSQDPEAKILSIRALGNDGFGTYSAVVSAVEYAINSEVDIINLSMYSPKTLASSVLETEIQKAIDSGITVVGAAGNDGKDASGYVPGAIDDAYIIGAATKDGVRIAGSNYGTTIDYYAVAGSTSEAAAKFSGYISKNGLDAATNDKTGLLFNSVANINTDIDVVDKDIATSKDNDTIYDPIIEKYVKEHADKSYVGEGEPSKLSMVNVMDVDATIASADQIHKNETIESMMSGDDFRFLFQQTGYVPVYQLGKDSDYFVAFADVMHNDKRASVVDLAVARNDVSGDEIEGIHYDKDSGLLYIPKTAFYGEDGKYYVQYLQTQILYSIEGYDVNSAWNSSVIATTEETDGDTESAFSGADIMNQRMTVQVGKNMDVNTMMVSVNGFPLDGTSTPYAVFAMYTSKFAGQHGFGLYKVLLKPSTGKLQLTKVSGNASGVSGNASYKLSGAKYGIYSDSGCKKLVKTIRTGTNAKVVVSLNTGTYYIKETAPSLGYGLDKTVHKVTIGAGSTSNVTSTEPPNPGTLTVKKRLDMFSIAKRTTRIGNMETTFTVYTNKGCTKVAKNTAGHNAVISINKGKVETAVGSVKLWAGTYYVKETGRISGTASNIEYVYGPVSVKAGKSVDVSSAVPVSERTNKTRMSGDGYVRDIPFHWSGRVLRKQDANGNALAGAVFKMNYSDLGGADYKVKYTWYFVSDKDGELKYDKNHLVDYSTSASAEAKAKYKGKSSALFQDTKTGNYYLPVCTIKVQEVMAPDGYSRDSTPRTLNISAPDKNEKYNTWTNPVAKLSNTGLIVKNDETEESWQVRARAFKVDENGKPLAGAWFGLYLTEADAKTKLNQVARLETKADGYTDTYTSGLLNGDISSYTLYCREIVSPPGYALSDTIYTKTFTKADYDALKAKDENTPGELQTFGDKTGIVNKKTGWNYSMQVKKVDDKGKPLAGAVFSIYVSKDDAESEDNALFTLKTGADGLTPLKTLKADINTKSVTYYCKEISAPEGYTINDDIFEQTWTYDEFNTIPSSQETIGKTKYFGPETGVVDPETLWTFSYYVKKVDNNGNPLAGAVFGVYTDSSCSEASKIQELETNDEGLTDTIPYNPGYSKQSVTLYCKELKAPEGYSIDNTVHSQTWNYKDYTASANTDTGEVKPFGPATGIVNDNSAWTVMMNIKKVSRFKKPLAGAVFGVYSDENCSNASYIGDLTTGDGGMSDTMSYDVPWKNVSVTLYCKETKAPSGYRLSNTVYKQTWYRAQYEELKKKAEQEQQAEGNADTSEGDGEDGGETDTTVGEVKPFGPIDGIPNDPTNWRLQFKVKKVDMKGNPLAKAEFTVYADKACTKALAKLVTKSDGWSDEAFLKTESIDGNGQASQYKLYCKETKAPEFYKLSDTVYEQTWTRKGYDTNNDEYGEVKIFGAESGIPNEPLKPVTVTVHKESKAASEILGLSGYSLEGAEFSITDGGSFKGTLKTNAKGISNSLELPNKTAEYTITETKAPAGHAISTPASQKLKVTMPNDASKDLTVTFSDDPVFTKNEFQITKKSEKNNVINGVLFKVEFVDSDNTTKKTWYLTSDSSGIVKMDNTHLNTDTAYKSDSFYTYNGKVVIPIGGKLKITEIKAPGQYVVDSTPKYLTTGTNATMKLEAINKLKPCKITIRKYDVDGKTPLKGVTFELKFIKEAEKLTTARDGFTRLLKVGGTTTGTTDANGYVVFDNLDQGEYQITEIKTTSGHTLLKDPITVTLPITMTKEEAAKNKADTSKATWDAATNKWQFYDCTFEVVNSATFKMPMSGGAGDWKYGIIGFGTLAVLGTGLILMDTRKKRMLNSRKQKRRRK